MNVLNRFKKSKIFVSILLILSILLIQVESVYAGGGIWEYYEGILWHAGLNDSNVNNLSEWYNEDENFIVLYCANLGDDDSSDYLLTNLIPVLSEYYDGVLAGRYTRESTRDMTFYFVLNNEVQFENAPLWFTNAIKTKSNYPSILFVDKKNVEPYCIQSYDSIEDLTRDVYKRYREFTGCYIMPEEFNINSSSNSQENGSLSLGDSFYYGTYPQTDVTDSLGSVLNSQGGTWHSYNYYSGSGSYSDDRMTASDYMRYNDVTYNGNKYRGVTFGTYRPKETVYESTSKTEYTYQDENGYTCENVYWFKYEPLEWRVLDASTGLVMCETIIDSQPYNNYIISNGTDGHVMPAYWGDSAQTYYANNYAKSSIRQWLNNDFYNIAFSDEQKTNIMTTTLNNDCYYTLTGNSGYEEFDAPSTSDKVFLLSYDQVINSGYGFDADASNYDSARRLQGSDYAKCQGLGVWNSSSSEYNGNSRWWLRSPSDSSGCACSVSDSGYAHIPNWVHYTSGGVVPALRLQNLKSDYAGSEAEEPQLPQLGELGIELEKEKYKATLGDSFDIKVTNLYLPAHEAGELIWESSDKSVSVVPHDKYATVTADKPGYSVITVYSHGGGYSDQCLVFVGDQSLVIGKEKGFLEVGKELEFMTSLCNADFVNMSDNKTVDISHAYASAEEISEITFVIADQSIATVTSTNIENGIIRIKIKGVSEGITYVTVTYNTTGESRYFPIYVTNSENTYYINSIPEMKSDSKNVYNICESGIYIYNFKAEDSGESYSDISFDAYNTTGIAGSVDVYNENGNLVKNIMINPSQNLPTDVFSSAQQLYYIVPAICDLSYFFENDITQPFNSYHTPVKFKLPSNGYFKVQNDITASTSCLMYNAVNITIDSISKIAGLKSDLPINSKNEVSQEVADKLFDLILNSTGLNSESGAYLNILSKLKDEMLKNVETFDVNNIFNTLNETLTYAELNIDYFELVKSTLIDVLKSAANEVLLSLDTTGVAKALYKYSKWENYITVLSDLNRYRGNGSTFIYNIQGGTKRISNGVIFEGSADDAAVFRTYEVSYGDVVDKLNSEYTKAKLYDISMVKNNKLTQPNAKSIIYIPIPLGYDKTNLKVYRINDDGSKVDMGAHPEGNYMVFETDHFSYYALVEAKGTKFVLQYNANGGFNSPANQTGNGIITLDSSIPSKNGYIFMGWNLEPDYSGQTYLPGASYYLNTDSTLYAVWKIDDTYSNPYRNPTITIKNFTPSLSVPYRSTVKLSVNVENAPEGATVHWFVNEEDVLTASPSESCSYVEVYNDFEAKAKLISKEGIVLAESESETIIVKNGFFSRLIAFFRALLGILPVIEQ